MCILMSLSSWLSEIQNDLHCVGIYSGEDMITVMLVVQSAALKMINVKCNEDYPNFMPNWLWTFHMLDIIRSFHTKLLTYSAMWLTAVCAPPKHANLPSGSPCTAGMPSQHQLYRQSLPWTKWKHFKRDHQLITSTFQFKMFFIAILLQGNKTSQVCWK